MEPDSSASDQLENKEGTSDQSALDPQASSPAEAPPESEASDSSLQTSKDQVEIKTADLQQATPGEGSPNALGTARNPSDEPVTTQESGASGNSTTNLQAITKSAQLKTEGEADENSQQPTPQGYDFKLVDETVREEFKCPICHLIARKPAKVSCCGHIFCHACIATETECPLCRDTFDSMIDKLLERKIRHQQVYCVNQDKGCEWTGELGDVWPLHLQDPTNQPQQPGTQRCLHQLTTCKKCDQELMYVELNHHMDSVCEHRMVRCEYQFAGCNFKGPEMNMPQHIQEKTTAHLALVSSLATNQKSVFMLARKKFQCCYWFTLAALVVALIFILGIAMVGLYFTHTKVNILKDTNLRLLEQLNESANHEGRTDNLVSQLSTEQKQIKKINSRLLDSVKQLNNESANHKVQTDDLVSQLRTERKRIKKINSRLLDSVKQLNNESANHKVQTDDLVSQLRAERKRIRNINSRLLDSVEQLKDESALHEVRIDNLVSQLSDELAKQDVSVDNLSSRLKDQTTEIVRLDSELRHLESEFSRMQSESYLRSILRNIFPEGLV